MLNVWSKLIMLVNVVKWMVVVIFLSVSLYNVICTIHSLFMMSSFHIQKCEDSNCLECQLLRPLIFLHSLQCKQDSCEITLCRVSFFLLIVIIEIPRSLGWLSSKTSRQHANSKFRIIVYNEV